MKYYAHQPETACVRSSASKIVLHGALFTLLSVVVAMQAAPAGVPAPAERAAAIVDAGEPRAGLSPGSLRLAIHVNRTQVEEDNGEGGDHVDDRRDSGDHENPRANPGKDNDGEQDENNDESVDQG